MCVCVDGKVNDDIIAWTAESMMEQFIKIWTEKKRFWENTCIFIDVLAGRGVDKSSGSPSYGSKRGPKYGAQGKKII